MKSDHSQGFDPTIPSPFILSARLQPVMSSNIWKVLISCRLLFLEHMYVCTINLLCMYVRGLSENYE